MKSINAVDIFNVVHPFTPPEWDKLPYTCHDFIHKEHACLCYNSCNVSAAGSAESGSKSNQDNDKPNESSGDKFGCASYSQQHPA